jgi:NAD/NADP transhydrogenase beta subunit
MVAAFGMLVAVVATFFKYVDGHPLHHVWLILLAIFIGPSWPSPPRVSSR